MNTLIVKRTFGDGENSLLDESLHFPRVHTRWDKQVVNYEAIRHFAYEIFL